MDMHKFPLHKQHFKHVLDDFWSMVSTKFSTFGLAFKEILDKNFMAMLPAKESQLRLYSKFKATQGLTQNILLFWTTGEVTAMLIMHKEANS